MTILSKLELPRLSVIIPAIPKKSSVERAVESVLSQKDPIGTEVVVACGEAQSSVADHLEAVFPEALSARRLVIARVAREGAQGFDRDELKNLGAEHAQGAWFTFLDPEHRFRPGRLERLQPWVSRHDLVVSAREAGPGESADWLLAFLRRNPVLPSSLAVSRSLFEEAGKFPVGYSGLLIPDRIPGHAEYEFCLRALITLERTDRRDRFAFVAGGTLAVQSPELGMVFTNQDIELTRTTSAPALRTPLQLRTEQTREALSILRVLRTLPRRALPQALRRVRDVGLDWLPARLNSPRKR